MSKNKLTKEQIDTIIEIMIAENRIKKTEKGEIIILSPEEANPKPWLYPDWLSDVDIVFSMLKHTTDRWIV